MSANDAAEEKGQTTISIQPIQWRNRLVGDATSANLYSEGPQVESSSSSAKRLVGDDLAKDRLRIQTRAPSRNFRSVDSSSSTSSEVAEPSGA